MENRNSTHKGNRRIAVTAFLLTLMLISLGPTAASANTNAYVANSGANLITVIDPASNTVVTTIPVGAAPRHVILAHDGARAYVTNSGSDSITVIDTATNTAIATIPVGDNPATLAITPDGKRLYVMIAGGMVEVVDTTLNAVIASVTVGSGGNGIAVTPDGTRVYVAAGLVSVIETAGNTVVASFLPQAAAIPGVSNTAVAVALSPDGARAYVSTVTFRFAAQGFSAAGGVALVDTSTNAVIQTIGLSSLPGSIAVSPDGSRAYVGITSRWINTGYGAGFLPGRSITVIDTAAARTAGGIDLGAGGSNWTLQNTPAGIAVTTDGAGVYASIPRINSVAVIDASSNLVTQTLPVSAGPNGIATVPAAVVVPQPVTVDAVNDICISRKAGRKVVANVLRNDTLGRTRVTRKKVTLSLVSSTNTGIKLNLKTGNVSVARGTAPGTYTLSYKICETVNPSNGDQATLTVTVK